MDLGSNCKSYSLFLEENAAFFNKSGVFCFANVPVSVNRLYGLYSVFEKGKSFIDLGCGIGNVLHFAQNIGYDVTGVDFGTYPSLSSFNVVRNDILAVDFDFIVSHDVIYSYRPFRYGFKPYLDILVSKMKKGQILILPDFVYSNPKLCSLGVFYYASV